MRSRTAGVLACAGLFAGEVGGALMHFPPFLPQHAVHTVAGIAAVILLALVTVRALLVWAGANRDRVALIVALLAVGGFAVIVNVLAPTIGWWSGLAFKAPLFPLAVLTGLRAMFVVGVVLALYRWVARYRRWFALLVYVAILVALVPGTIEADQTLLDAGVLEFAQGYRIWHDVLLGEWFFIFPLAVYECLRVRTSVA
jgi:hypothetical protein